MAKKKEVLTIEEKLKKALVPDWEQPYKVPSNWVWTRLGEVCVFENGFAFKSTDYKETGIPLLRISNIQNKQIDFTDCVYIDKEVNERYLVNNGDLLIALSGATTGKNGVYQFDKPAYLNQRVGNLKVVNERIITKKFRDCYIEEKTEEILKNAYGGAQPNISPKDLSAFTFPLPPLAEQKRIVERIESLFSKLDEAKELAQSALDSFENRKSAILHKAFTGELTKKWREENGTIRDVSELFPLSDLCISFQYGTSSKSDKSGEVAVIRMGNLQSGEIDWTDLVYSNNIEDNEKYKLKKGDVLFNRTNSPVWVGKTSIYRGEYPAIFAGYLIRLNYKSSIIGDYLNYMLNTPQAKDYCLKVKTDGVNQSNINAKKIAAFEIPCPDVAEQKEIVRILDSIFEKETKAKECANVIEQIDLMKKAILARAFRGELGTNDESDESAVELLKGILEEK